MDVTQYFGQIERKYYGISHHCMTQAQNQIIDANVGEQVSVKITSTNKGIRHAEDFKQLPEGLVERSDISAGRRKWRNKK